MTLSPSNTSVIRASFKGTAGYDLSARLDLPAGPVVSVEGELDTALSAKLIEIAGKCPVHRTLEMGSAVVTRVEAASRSVPNSAHPRVPDQ